MSLTRDQLLAVEMFPVLMGVSIHNEGQVCVPLAIVTPHEKQAIANHSQKLWTLASRGGLSPGELAAVLEDRPHKAMPVHEAWGVIYKAIESIANERGRQQGLAEAAEIAIDSESGYWAASNIREHAAKGAK